MNAYLKVMKFHFDDQLGVLKLKEEKKFIPSSLFIREEYN